MLILFLWETSRADWRPQFGRRNYLVSDPNRVQTKQRLVVAKRWILKFRKPPWSDLLILIFLPTANSAHLCDCLPTHEVASTLKLQNIDSVLPRRVLLRLIVVIKVISLIELVVVAWYAIYSNEALACFILKLLDVGQFVWVEVGQGCVLVNIGCSGCTVRVDWVCALIHCLIFLPRGFGSTWDWLYENNAVSFIHRIFLFQSVVADVVGVDIMLKSSCFT